MLFEWWLVQKGYIAKHTNCFCGINGLHTSKPLNNTVSNHGCSNPEFFAIFKIFILHMPACLRIPPCLAVETVGCLTTTNWMAPLMNITTNTILSCLLWQAPITYIVIKAMAIHTNKRFPQFRYTKFYCQTFVLHGTHHLSSLNQWTNAVT